jgi:bifunctional non-homologous end joining protein LigD
MALEKYVDKRDLERTPEPSGGEPTHGLPTFVVQLHRATRLHHDFRLEHQGVMKSWAVPKGPSLDPADKRLAVMVEDHPMDYRSFEGIIPKGNYGAGTVMVWDEGTYVVPGTHTRAEIEHTVTLGLGKGHVVVFLNGSKLRGLFDLIKLHGQEENAWLLVKRQDEFSSSDSFEDEPRSLVSNRTLEEIRTDAPSSGQVWYSDRERRYVDYGGAPEGPMPKGVRPMLAQEAHEPFDREGWLFEVKWDGFRALAEVELEGEARLYSRNGNSFADRFPAIVSSLKTLGHAVVLDGEVVTVDQDGVSQFQWLQDYGSVQRGTLLYYVFDILYLDGHVLRGLPLRRRRDLLRAVIGSTDRIRLSDHVEGSGLAFYRAIQARGLEGMMAKDPESTYSDGVRTSHWVKVKWLKHHLGVVAGFTAPKNSRKHFGALVLGAYEGEELVHIGQVGGGFTDVELERIWAMLQPLRREQSSFRAKAATNGPVTWLEPRLVCSVTFRGWTSAGQLRQPVFDRLQLEIDAATVMLRPDTAVSNRATRIADVGEPQRSVASSATESATVAVVTSEKALGTTGASTIEIDGHNLRLTNLDKMLWEEDGYTKRDLIAYYWEMGEVLVPYLINRPESLHRHPNGIAAQAFFQKDTPTTVPKWLRTVELESGSERRTIRYLLCQDVATLVYMANLACIEVNPWNSSLPNLGRPDYAIIDLDPHEVGFDAVVKTALVVKTVLDDLGVAGYPKTSGATGIHIFVPMGAQYSTEQSVQFAGVVATLVHQRLPKITSLERTPARRVGKVYLDYLQNREGQTVASVYSVRPKPGAPVSAPLAWAEVNGSLHPADFTIRTMRERLDRVGDLWAPVLGPGIDMHRALERIG